MQLKKSRAITLDQSIQSAPSVLDVEQQCSLSLADQEVQTQINEPKDMSTQSQVLTQDQNEECLMVTSQDAKNSSEFQRLIVEIGMLNQEIAKLKEENEKAKQEMKLQEQQFDQRLQETKEQAEFTVVHAELISFRDPIPNSKRNMSHEINLASKSVKAPNKRNVDFREPSETNGSFDDDLPDDQYFSNKKIYIK